MRRRMMLYDDLPTPTWPVKGDLIRMNLDGTNRQYRVMNINNSIAEVVGMFNASESVKFSTNTSSYDTYYFARALDTYLNTTWYNTLSSTAKTAIVSKSKTQCKWSKANGKTSSYIQCTYTNGSSTSYYYLQKLSDTDSANRKVYALSIQDLLDYFADTTVRVDTQYAITSKNIWKMLWNTTTQPSSSAPGGCWLRDERGGSGSGYAYYVGRLYGYIHYDRPTNTAAARPALTIDLSKITWEKV